MLDFLILLTLRRRSLKERFSEVKSTLLAWLPEAEATTAADSVPTYKSSTTLHKLVYVTYSDQAEQLLGRPPSTAIRRL
jgi:hypothetical protein